MVKKKIYIYIYMDNNDTLKKIKSRDAIDEYMEKINVKCEKFIPSIKKMLKIDSDSIVIPTISNYEDIYKYNYNLNQLKLIAKNYKLKISGNKPQLVSRIFSYLYFSLYIIKIQKNIRRFLVKKYTEYHGPAAMNRKLCTNSDDFFTMEPVEEINFHQFLSYKDDDGFVYGFDIISLHNLFLKSMDSECVKNPYNRNLIPNRVLKLIKTNIRLSRIFKIQINLYYEDDTQTLSNEKAVELRAVTLFQSIDVLGNYSNSQWFLSLNRQQLLRLVRELCDIWNYRAQLSTETKRNICPPHGDPFRHLSIQYIHNEPNICNVKKAILDVLEKFVNSGTNNDNKALGAYYVLGALTLVNSEAAISLPWLFQSFGHF